MVVYNKHWNFESRRIVVSEVRHLWNCLIAELDSRNESSSLAKIGTFDDSCIAFHSRVRWQIGGSRRARNMAEIYYLPRKTFTDRTDGRLYQDTEKIPLSPNSAQPIDRRKAASDQLKSKLRTAFKADSPRPEGPTQRRVTFQTPPTNEHLLRPILLLIHTSVHVQIEQKI